MQKNTCFFSTLLMLLFFSGSMVQAAEIAASRGLIINRPQQQSKPELPAFLPEKPSPGLNLPKVPKLPKLNLPKAPDNAVKLKLNAVVFEGNTIFSDNELQQIAGAYIGQAVTMIELEQLRYQLTRYYTDRGYINSGAIIKPGQIVTNGQVIFKIHEGVLNEVKVSGTERLKPSYISSRIWPDNKQIFNTLKLQEYFQLMLYDPLVERMDGRLIPGIEPGSAILDLKVKRARPYNFNFKFDNGRTPGTGSERGTLSSQIYNLTGQGDRLDLKAEHSKGATEWAAGFSIPLNPHDTRLSIRYDTTQSTVVEGPLAGIDIENKYDTLELGISHPVWKDLNGHLLLGSTLSLRENQGFLLGQSFPFSPSDDSDGKSAVSVIRFWQDYQLRNTSSVLALRSSFNFGLDLFDATTHSNGLADGRFFSWLGQLQYAHRVLKDAKVVFRSDIQLANDKLLALEKFSLGGINTIRGYRENTLVRDQAYLLSLEFQYPLFSHADYGSFQIAPFVDFGEAWNYREFKHKDYLFSLGAGVIWNIKDRLDAAVYIAHEIKNAPEYSDNNLQDKGIHFRINLQIL